MSLLIIKRALIALLLIFRCLSGFGQSPVRDTNYTYRAPQQLNDGIETGDITNAHVNSIKIIKLTRLILADTFKNIHSLLIMQDNKLVYENYFPGKDEIWGLKLGYTKHNMNTLHDVRSISKSIVSACIGITV